MIRKLRAKFIITNMLLISIVLVAAFVFVFFSTAKNLEDESIASMKELSSKVSESKYTIFGDPFKEDENNNHSYFTMFAVEVDTRTLNCNLVGYDTSGEELTQGKKDFLISLITAVYNENKSQGLLEEFNYRYYTVSTSYGNRIVFRDKGYEDATLNKLMVNFLIVGMGALAAFFFISVVIAKIAVAPVEKSLKQQAQLVADASHELKTPITVISANADILIANKDEKINSQIKWVEYIKTEASRMTALVNNMLFLAKTDDNKKAETQSIINLSDTATSCVLPFESVSFEKKKSLEIAINPDIYIKGNENSIKQLIIILVDNAFKYSDDNGRIKVTVSEDQDKVEISVWNSGTPIPAEQIPHIFERFYRVDKSRSRSEGGYGLGLSIASSIIESHNAKINVHSTEERGTTFTCTFKKQKMK